MEKEDYRESRKEKLGESLIYSELSRYARHDTPLRIAVVTETYPPEINGVAMTTQRLVDGVVKAGHSVQLIRPRQTHETRLDDAVTKEGIEQILSRGIPIPRYNSLQMGLPARQALLKHWSRRRPDIVQVVTEGPLGWSAISAARKLRIPVVSEFHTNFHSYTKHYGMAWLKRPIAAYLRKFHNGADLTLVPTRALQSELRAYGFQKIAVVARGVDTNLFNSQRRSESLRRSWGVLGDELAVIHVGRLAAEKNLGLVERAFAAICAVQPSARMVMVGDGPERQALEAKHPDWIFAGMRSGEDLATHYASGDLFLFPSLTETFGNVLTEALASGLPTVSYHVAAAAELLEHLREGWLTEPGNEADFISGAVHLAQDAALRSTLSRNALQLTQDLHWSEISSRLINAFQDVIQHHLDPSRTGESHALV